LAIWCRKNSPNFFSTSDVLPFFDDEDEEDEAVDVDGVLRKPGITSASSHM